MKYLLLILMLFMTACTQVCKLEKTVAGAMSLTVSHTLSCANPDQVQADMQKLLDRSGICPVSGRMKGIVGNLVCPIVGQLVVTELGNQIPPSWQCTPTGAQQTLNALIQSACAAVPF